MEEQVYEKSIFDEEQIPVVYASFWERFAALLIDFLVLLPLTIINAYNRASWNSMVIVILTTAALIIYKPLMEYLYAATLGKKAMSIVVANKNFGKPGLKEVLLRSIFKIIIGVTGLALSVLYYRGYRIAPVGTTSGLNMLQSSLGYTNILSGITGLVYITDVVVFLANNQNRALHDYIGGTFVISKK